MQRNKTGECVRKHKRSTILSRVVRKTSLN